jgi:hypothetical protein
VTSSNVNDARGRPSRSLPRYGISIRLVFLSVVAIFWVQFFLKQYRYEPYPTLLMPGGAAQYHDDPEGLVYVVDELFALGPAGQTTRFSFGEAFPEIPAWYWDRIIGNSFGLTRTGPHRDPIRLGPINVPIPTGITTEDDARETRMILRNRIEPLVEHPVDSLRFNRARYRLRQDTGETELIEVRRERSVSLVEPGPGRRE